jgi:hypothetical protein
MTKSRGIGRGGKREGSGRPKGKGIPKKNIRVPIEVAETIKEDNIELEKVIRRSRIIDFTEGQIYYLEDSQKYLIAVDDLEELGYRVVSHGGITNICKVHL